jgi:hypothetical protein
MRIGRMRMKMGQKKSRNYKIHKRLQRLAMRKWASGGKEDIRCNLLGTMRREGATFHGCVPTDTTLGTIVFFDYRNKRGADKYITR